MEKSILTMDELAAYTGLSKSYLYKLNSQRKIPAYKPFNKCLFFDFAEIQKWLKQNPIANAEALEVEANTITTLKPGGK